MNPTNLSVTLNVSETWYVCLTEMIKLQTPY